MFAYNVQNRKRILYSSIILRMNAYIHRSSDHFAYPVIANIFTHYCIHYYMWWQFPLVHLCFPGPLLSLLPPPFTSIWTLSLTPANVHSIQNSHFSKCMQNDVTMVHCSMSSFHKKSTYYECVPMNQQSMSPQSSYTLIKFIESVMLSSITRENSYRGRLS